MKKQKLPSEEIQHLLTSIIDNFNDEDVEARQRQIRQWRGLKLFWEGFSRAWYSEVAHDWKIWDDQQQDGAGNIDQSYYDKPVNVFKAYLESIIAALSVTVPPIKCYPDNANDPLDLLTAKAGDKIAQLVYRHNDVPLLWVHALFLYCTEGLVASYRYTDRRKEYGETTENQYEEVEQFHEESVCPNCGMQLDEKFTDSEEDEFDPDNDDAALHNIMFNEGQEICPGCAQLVDPQLQKTPFVVTRIVGVINQPKARQCIDVLGGLNVRVASWARKQSECPTLDYSYETHVTTAIEMFPHLKDSMKDILSTNTPSGNDLYERWGRTPLVYRGSFPQDVVTIKHTWLRKSTYNYLEKVESAKIKAKYPDGCKVTYVNGVFAEACNDNLDDSWTLSYNPLADYIHHQPIGVLLVSIQEITNDLISLILQTIEHGIPQTFADPSIMDFKGYSQLEAMPGAIIPTKTISSSRQISQGFYEVKTAALSHEVLPFAQKIQELGQLVSGALPSLFGGNIEGSGTASEYSMSRAQALQRLQTTWKIITLWWKNTFGKVIPAYIKDVTEDEREVSRDANGNFINLVIRKSELEGKLGKIELEANENLPISWNQRKDMIFQLLQSANPEVMGVLAAPENLPIIREALGFTDFHIPGEDDVMQQYEEIKLLLNSEPMVLPPPPEIVLQAQMEGMPPPPEEELPSIEVDPIYDNHKIGFEICRGWVVSEEGQQAKITNPPGYKNVLLHGKMHYMMMQQQMAPMDNGAAPPEKPNQLDKEVPIQGEGDVQTA